MIAGTLPQPANRSIWGIKFIECSLGCVAVLNSLSICFELLHRALLEQLQGISTTKIYGIELALSLVCSFLLSFYWQRKEKQSPAKTVFFHPVLLGILRYCLAFEISTYGFAKILKTQFAHSFQHEDSVMHALSGMNLTWQYFSHSYALAVIIGLIQIGGSVLLLFRRTTLLGTVILLPVLINILLINIFYHIGPGPFVNAILLNIGLGYLLLQRWQQLKELFLSATDNLPRLPLRLLKYPLKVLPIAAAFSMIYYLMSSYSPARLTGKWKVDFMIRYGDTVKADAWLTDASIWSNIYLEDYSSIAVCSNPYLFDAEKSMTGTYHYNDSTKVLQLAFPNRRVNIAVNNFDGKKMEWHSMIKKDSLFVVLKRISGP